MSTDAEPLYRLITTILDPRARAGQRIGRPVSRAMGNRDGAGRVEDPFARRAALCCAARRRNWSGRSFIGLLLAHFAIRGLMHEAALKADEDPDRLSFRHSVRRCPAKHGARRSLFPPRRKRQTAALLEDVLAEILQERVVSSRSRSNPRAVKRTMTAYQILHRPRVKAGRQTGSIRVVPLK